MSIKTTMVSSDMPVSVNSSVRIGHRFTHVLTNRTKPAIRLTTTSTMHHGTLTILAKIPMAVSLKYRPSSFLL